MSGYNEINRYQILCCGTNGYDKLLAKEGAGIRPFCIRLIIKDKKFEKSKWYKTSSTRQGQIQNKFTSVFFVPATPGSKHLNMPKKCEELHKVSESCRIRFI